MHDMFYVNNPITLPVADAPLATVSDPQRCEETAHGLAFEPAQNAEQVYWFRWISGHQLTFGFWQALRRQLAYIARSLNQHGSADPLAIERCSQLIRGVSALYVYSGSCTRAVYAATIRRFMGIFHGGFSGTWAADYRGISDLVGFVCAYSHSTHAQAQGNAHAAIARALTELKQAERESHSVHVAVAKKLVPEGRSLLGELKAHGSVVPLSETARFIYDSFFLVQRTAITAHDLEAAVGLRAQRVLADLNANQLYPQGSSSASEAPEELAHGRLARYATEQSALLERAMLACRAVFQREAGATIRPSSRLPRYGANDDDGRL